MKQVYCETCKFAYNAPWIENNYAVDTDEWVFECRRFPPPGANAVRRGDSDAFPRVSACEFCGEYKKGKFRE